MSANNDPLEFIKGMWGSMGINLPGMVTPTLDVDELEKRITDLKTVEGWLKMNLNMLSMSIQGLEMQRTTLAAMKAMGQASENGDATNAFAAAALNPALWPWNFMQQAQDQAAGGSAAQAQSGDKGDGQK